jgi:thymidylate kinase
LLQRGNPLDIDETQERAEQMKRAYHEIQKENCIPRLQRTIWHTIDASKKPEIVADDAWNILKNIIGLK